MKLRDYQHKIANKAVKLLREYKIAYLAMQTRTGKTMTALHAADMYGAKNVLFVTKKKAINSIQTDYDKGDYGFYLTVINYESLHKSGVGFDLIICDEAHSIGQFPKPNNRCRNLRGKAVGLPIIYLSATPSPESYSQLYHQFWISSYSPLRSYSNFYKFAADFVRVKKRHIYNREVNDYSDCDSKKLAQYIRHLFITYTQEEAGFEVSVDEKILTARMPDSLYEIINSINKNKVYTDNGYEIVADTAVKVMQKIHQISSGTVIDENGYQVLSDYKARFISDKFEGYKLAIFYKFKSERDMLAKTFDSHTDVAEDFQAGNANVFLGQFLSAREGIRLDQADAIIFFNIDFSFLSYEQARNRIASFERKKTATLYWIFSDKGIEKYIYSRVKNKEDYTLAHYRHDRKQI